MKYKINKSSAGFSLVEILVYMSLMSIFLVVLLSMFTAALNTRLSSESTSGIFQDSRYILSKLSYDINNADSIIYPDSGSTNTSLQLMASGFANTYSLSDGNLVKTVDGVSMNLNGTDTQIDSISFKNIGNTDGKPTIQIIYTIRSKIIIQGGRTETQVINTTMGTR